MAHKKADGLTRNDRDSEAKRLGAKRFGSETVLAGSIIVCQRGTKFHAGTNAGCGRDRTLFVLTDGKVRFKVKSLKSHKFISVVTEQVFRVPVTDESPAIRCGTFYIHLLESFAGEQA